MKGGLPVTPQPQSGQPPSGSSKLALHPAANGDNAPQELPQTWDLTCADCGAAWSVSVDHIVQSDDWFLCPGCQPASDPSSGTPLHDGRDR